MPREQRKRSESGFYHVVARGCGRQVVFECDDDYRAFLRFLKCDCEEFHITLLAWCLMSNHIHVLLCDPEGNLSACMHRVMTSYAMRFNTVHGHVGHVFQDRFKSRPVENDEHLLQAVLYIHENPETASLCDVREYRWSSYREYAGFPGVGVIVDTSIIFDVVGGREAFVSLSASGKGRGAYRFEGLGRRTDEEARECAEEILGEVRLDEVKALEKGVRGRLIRQLAEVGLSIRQIERLTGIGRQSVARLIA